MTTLFELQPGVPPRKAVGFKLFSHWEWSEIAPRVDGDVLEALQKIRPFDSTLAWSVELRDVFGPRGEKPRQEWLVAKGTHDGLLALGAKQGPKFKTLRVFVHDPRAALDTTLIGTEKRAEVTTVLTILRDRLLGRPTEFPVETRPLRDDSCFSSHRCNGSCNALTREGPSSLDLHDEERGVFVSLTQPHGPVEKCVTELRLAELKQRARERGLARAPVGELPGVGK